MKRPQLYFLILCLFLLSILFSACDGGESQSRSESESVSESESLSESENISEGESEGNTEVEHTHTYDHDCDAICNDANCGEVRETAHVFDHDCDGECNTVGCGYTRVTTHAFGDWRVTRPASLDLAGERLRECGVCGHSETEEIARLTYALSVKDIGTVVTVTEAVRQYMDAASDRCVDEFNTLKTDGLRNDQCVPVTLTYTRAGSLGDGDVIAGATLYLSETPDFSDASLHALGEGETAIDIYNLFPDTTYFYKVVETTADGAAYESNVGRFAVADYPRMMTVDGINNVRDIGGKVGLQGYRIRYGLLYRGSELDGYVQPSYKLTDEGRAYMLDTLGIRHDLDLRSAGDAALGDGVTHKLYSYHQYATVIDQSVQYRELYAAVYRDLLASDGLPSYLHCTYGADRTGTVCFILEALLGVSKENLVRDYELTGFYHSTVTREREGFKELCAAFERLPGESYAQKAEYYVITMLGLTKDEVEAIRVLFLDGYTAHTCVYGEWVSDAAGDFEIRTCDGCGSIEKRQLFNGEVLLPTFTVNADKTLYTVTVPGEQIKYTGVYRFRIKGDFTIGEYGKYCDVTTSSDERIHTRMKISEADLEGYTQAWLDTLILAEDADGDGLFDDVTISLDMNGTPQYISEISLYLVGEVAAYTAEKRGDSGTEGTVGVIPSVKKGTYAVAAFFNGANEWKATVRIGDGRFVDSATGASTVTALGNYHNYSAQHNGSTRTAGLMLLGYVSFDTDVQNLETAFTYTGHLVTGGGKEYVPILLLRTAETHEHGFDNDCDTTCEGTGCGYTRTVPHVFDHDCDMTCNECGTVRIVLHKYDNFYDGVCNTVGCGFTRETLHVYDHACDATCNECGTVRFVVHKYDNFCDGVCNTDGCGFTRETAHILGTWYVFRPATASQSGERRRECYICTYYEAVEIPYVGSYTLSVADLGTVVTVADAVRQYMDAPSGTSVKEYNANGTALRYDRSVPVTLSYTRVGSLFVGTTLSGVTLYLSDSASFSDTVLYSFESGKTEIDVYNLIPNTTYYYKVVETTTGGATYESNVGSFTVADYPRMMYIDGINNVRDIGGKVGLQGCRIKYEMIYRGSEMDAYKEPSFKLTDEGMAYMLDTLGVRYDLDLRGEGTAAFGDSTGYRLCSYDQYNAVIINGSKKREKYAPILRVFADEASYPVYAHCTYGADRTGTLFFLLEALLGVSKEDIIRDYELTGFYHTSVARDRETFQKLITAFENLRGDTYAEKAEYYMINSLHLTKEEIEEIRALLLDGYEKEHVCSYEKWEAKKLPTATETGAAVSTCAVCGGTAEKILPTVDAVLTNGTATVDAVKDAGYVYVGDLYGYCLSSKNAAYTEKQIYDDLTVSAELYMMWDGERVYVYVEVSDTAVVSRGKNYLTQNPSATANLYKNDSIEFYSAIAGGDYCKTGIDALGYTAYFAGDGSAYAADVVYATRLLGDGDGSILASYKESGEPTVAVGVSGYAVEFSFTARAEPADGGAACATLDALSVGFQVNDATAETLTDDGTGRVHFGTQPTKGQAGMVTVLLG